MNTANEIMELTNTTGKNAPAMTESLRIIGGDMQSGIKKVGEFFYEEGLSQGYSVGISDGEISGFCRGGIVATVVFAVFGTGCFLYRKHKLKAAQTKHKAEGKEILDALKATVPSNENSAVKTTAEPQINESELINESGKHRGS